MYHVNEVSETDAAFPQFYRFIMVSFPCYCISSFLSFFLIVLSLSLSKHIHSHIDRSYDRLPVKTIGQNRTLMRQ